MSSADFIGLWLLNRKLFGLFSGVDIRVQRSAFIGNGLGDSKQ